MFAVQSAAFSGSSSASISCCPIDIVLMVETAMDGLDIAERETFTAPAATALVAIGWDEDRLGELLMRDRLLAEEFLRREARPRGSIGTKRVPLAVMYCCCGRAEEEEENFRV